MDVSRYKPTTLRRRIARRIALVHAAGAPEYLERLQASGDELNALHDDFFIHVTSFFRDPDVFAALEERVFPVLAGNRANGGAPIRVWVPGGSTGEEPYSVAMALFEHLEARGSALSIQVFGTDVSDRAIRRARAAEFDAAIAERVSARRLARFFDQTASGYRVKRFVRDACVFVRHDVTVDPPFSRMTSCPAATS